MVATVLQMPRITFPLENQNCTARGSAHWPTGFNNALKRTMDPGHHVGVSWHSPLVLKTNVSNTGCQVAKELEFNSAWIPCIRFPGSCYLAVAARVAAVDGRFTTRDY